MKRSEYILIFLFILPLAFAAPDGYEPDNSAANATWINITGTPQTHTFDPGNDTDFVMFNATKGDYYLIQTVNLSAADTVNHWLYLYDTDGATYLSADYTGMVGSSWSARIVWRALSTGTYFVEADEANGTAGGSYNISVQKLGVLHPYLVYPSSWTNITKYRTFNFTAGVTCVGGPCYDVNAILDPEPSKLGPGIGSALEQDGEARVLVKLKDRPVESLTIDDILEFKKSKKAREAFLEKFGGLEQELQNENRKKLKDQIKENQDNVLGRLNLANDGSGLSVSGSYDFRLNRRYSLTNAFSGVVTQQGLDKLLNDPDVEYVSLDRIVHASLDVTVPRIDADDAWGITVNGISMNGTGQTVCVLDTGINYSHPDFGNYSTFPNPKVVGGYCYLAGEVVGDSNGYCLGGGETHPTPFDDHGHGSHVSGIVASEDATYRGVAPGARIVSIKVLNGSGSGYTSDLVAGIDWCIDNASAFNISVISMSLGGNTYDNNGYGCDDYDLVMAQAVDNAVANNILVSIASGNYYGSYPGISEPACHRNATSVGITNPADDTMYSWGQRSSTLDLLAPGLAKATAHDGTHEYRVGTSMSCPHVSGAALILQQFFSESYNRTLAPKEAEWILKSNALDVYDSTTAFTYKRIDVYDAVTSKGIIPDTIGALPFYTTTSNPYQDSCLSSMANGTSCNVSWTVNATGDMKNYTFFTIFETDYLINTTSRLNITIRNSVPVLASPWLNNATGNTTNIFNFTVNYSDADDHAPFYIYLSINGTNHSMLPGDASDVNFTDGDNLYYYQTALPHGNHTYRFMASDRFSSTGTGVYTGPNVSDNSPPSILNLSPSDNAKVGSGLQAFSFLPLDDSNISMNCSLNFDGVSVNSTVAANNVSTALYYMIPSGGWHVWNISCSDAAHTVFSETRVIGYDTSAPSITLISPADSTLLTTTVEDFTFSEADGMYSNVSCSLVIGSTVSASNATVLNSTTTAFSAVSLNAGSLTWYVNCTDPAGNTASSASRTLTVPQSNYSASVNATAGVRVNLDATSSVDMNLTTSSNVTGTVVVAQYSINPTNTSASSANGFAALGLSTFVLINASSNISGSLAWYLLSIYYSDGALPSNIEESTLRIYFFNATSGDWEQEPNSGVDTSANRVWANITHFSVFSAGGAQHVSTGGGGGGGGGGGSASASSEPILITPTLSAQLVEAPKSQEILVNTEVGSYLFKVKSFTGTLATVFSAETGTATLVNGLSKGFDLDADGKFDITMTYSGYYSGRAMLVFYSVPHPEPILLLPPKPRESKNAEPESEPDQTAEEAVAEVEEQAAPALPRPVKAASTQPTVPVQLESSFFEENKLPIFIGGIAGVIVIVFLIMNLIFSRRGPPRAVKKEVSNAVNEVRK